MPRPPEFSEEDKIKMLLWCERHCCLCGKDASTDIEIAHIERGAGNNIDNGMPLCYGCHAKIGHYNREHPRGNKYKPRELKARRDQIYDEYTRHLVPGVHFWLDQTMVDGTTKHLLPFVGFRMKHLSDSLPAKVKVEAKILIGEGNLGLVADNSGYYTGNTTWNLNPRVLFWGGFSISPEQFLRVTAEELKVEVRITIIDQFDRPHMLLPQCWRWVSTGQFWNLEPRQFTEWT
jgi:hypothetical protein